MTSDILYERRGHTGLVTLNRPAARNALTFEMYEEVKALCARAGTENDPDRLKAIVITGAGDKAFAAGTDISRFANFGTMDDAVRYEEMIEGVLRQVEDCAVPVIAALHGAVTGGGAVIAAACHLRYGTAGMRLGMPIARTLGNCLSIANLRRLVRLLGDAEVHRLILTAELLDDEAALRRGFVSDVFSDKEATLEHALTIADRISTLAPLTLRSSMEGLRRLREATPLPDDHDLIERCYMSEDFREGMAAFFDKRKPNWKGK
ncbi:enoyl-CoA hydratase [Alphaproteobacteria bacterium LSUCC0684]